MAYVLYPAAQFNPGECLLSCRGIVIIGHENWRCGRIIILLGEMHGKCDGTYSILPSGKRNKVRSVLAVVLAVLAVLAVLQTDKVFHSRLQSASASTCLLAFAVSTHPPLHPDPSSNHGTCMHTRINRSIDPSFEIIWSNI